MSTTNGVPAAEAAGAAPGPPPAGSSESSREAADRLQREAEREPLKDRRGVEVTPP